jgi:hypothetical protein
MPWAIRVAQTQPVSAQIVVPGSAICTLNLAIFVLKLKRAAIFSVRPVITST